MKTYTLHLIFILMVLQTHTQTLKLHLSDIKTTEDAKVYIRSSNDTTVEIINFNSKTHKTPLADALFKIPKGKIKHLENNTYKILEKERKTLYRVRIIEFDRKKTSLADINSLRVFIVKGVSSGEHKFENLARVYSRHPSRKTGGDLGWAHEGTLPKNFENTIKGKPIGKPFIFDMYREKKHYVALKTNANTYIDEITVLKLSSNTK